ncbi:hypothetical protein JOB18_004267 [Solea senegalensis]|uniref:Uncharacterized protein n=1 Tax=Solea senegalensis TaxID=28829 RepID=A0AAV6QKR0_SOLSE|nr:hypothetical protein JOB18_004267 [Solea senegalensis]
MEGRKFYSADPDKAKGLKTKRFNGQRDLTCCAQRTASRQTGRQTDGSPAHQCANDKSRGYSNGQNLAEFIRDKLKALDDTCSSIVVRTLHCAPWLVFKELK